MAAMSVSSCCCGCSLRTGTIAIGYVYAIIGVIVTLLAIVGLGVLNNVPPEKLGLDTNVPLTIVSGVVLAGALIQTAVSVCLVYGGMQERVSFLMPWIIYALISAALAKLSFVTLLLRHQTSDSSIAIPLCMQAVQAVLYIYFMVVVRSYRTSLLQKKEDEVVLVQPDKISLA